MITGVFSEGLASIPLNYPAAVKKATETFTTVRRSQGSDLLVPAMTARISNMVRSASITWKKGTPQLSIPEPHRQVVTELVHGGGWFEGDPRWEAVILAALLGS